MTTEEVLVDVYRAHATIRPAIDYKLAILSV
jgi:hypothetical protein